MKELTRERMVRLGIFEEFHNVELGKLKLVSKPAMASVVEYVKKIDECFKKGIGLYLWGQNGRGKTASAIGVLKEAHKKGYSVYNVSLNGAKELYTTGWYDHASKDSFNRMVREVEFLVVDEIGKDKTSIAVGMLENLVRYRTQMRLPTIAVSNLKLGELEKEYQNLSISSMLKGNFLPVFFDGPDIREHVMSPEIGRFLSPKDL